MPDVARSDSDALLRSLWPRDAPPDACAVRFDAPELADRLCAPFLCSAMTCLSFERAASGSRWEAIQRRVSDFQVELGSQAVAELRLLLEREKLGKLLQHLLL